VVSQAGLTRAVVVGGSLLAVGIAVHTAINLRHLRRPEPRSTGAPSRARERISILIPARNEADTITMTLRSAAEQRLPDGDLGVDLEILILDDGSTDETAVLAAAVATDDPRISVMTAPDAAPPRGWLGKPWACQRLAARATGSVLAFVDADVELVPDAVVALVDTLRDGGFAMVAPYPHQESDSWLERLIQPLVTWSWAATMPLAWAERSTRPSLSAANGQLLVVDAEAYRSVGGHEAVAGDVLEDIALMRAFKRAGLRTATVDGSHLARCRMYLGPQQVIDGYSKSLWDAFNGPTGSIGVMGLLGWAYVVPAVAVVTSPRNRRISLLGYAAGVVSRAMVARRTGERIFPDTLAQPASIAAFIALNALSWQRHLRGTNTWKGRPVVAEVDA
jgi:GT2 family glycosyltransferase